MYTFNDLLHRKIGIILCKEDVDYFLEICEEHELTWGSTGRRATNPQQAVRSRDKVGIVCDGNRLRWGTPQDVVTANYAPVNFEEFDFAITAGCDALQEGLAAILAL